MTKHPGLIRCLPFGIYIGLMAADPILRPLLPAALDSRWAYGMRAGLVLVVMAVLWRFYTELKETSVATPWEWALGLVMGVGVFFLWINLYFTPLSLTPCEGFDPRTDGRVDVRLAAMRLSGAILVVPVMEELFWRSFLMRWLQHPKFLSVDPSAVGWRAILFSSILFATEHRLWFAGLLAGLAYGWLYKRSGNLWVPILAHAVTNGLLGAYVLSTGSWTFW